MEQILHQILSTASTVILPHFGAIIKLGESYQFNEFLKYNDGKLIKAVEEAKGVSTEDATEIVSDYIRSIKESLNADKDFEISTLGVFSKKADKVIIKKGANSPTKAENDPAKPTESKTVNKPKTTPTPPKKESSKIEVTKTEAKKATSEKNAEELPKAYTSTNLIVDKAIEKINAFTSESEITAFIKGEKREQVLTVASEKKNAIITPKTAPLPTPKVENKEKVKPVISEPQKPKSAVENEPKENKTKVAEPKKVESPKEETKKTVVAPVKTPKTTEAKEVKKVEHTAKIDETRKVTPSSKEKAKEDDVKEALKAGAIVIEKEAKKRKRNRLILWVAILLLLIGSSIIGYLKKNEILAIINKTEIAEHKDAKDSGHGETHSEKQHSDTHKEKDHSDEATHNENHSNDEEAETLENAEHVSEASTKETSQTEEIAAPEETQEQVTEEEEVVEEVVEEEPEEIEEVQPVAKGKYNIIVGSFSEESNANKLVKKLNEEGYNNAKVLGKYGGLHAVSIDNFESRSDAKSALSDIKAKGFSGWIKKI